MYSSREPIPSEYRGVKLGDKELFEEFGDTIPAIACYGGIEPSENIKAFLSLPAKFRIFTRMDLTQAKKKAEEAAVSERWDIMDRQEREQNGERLSPDELRRQKDLEHRERQSCTSLNINMSKV